ncbi:MAG: DUF4870 domain-containing protein [Phycisphaerales bacterium]|nr:DUF4870 domain-containing protein [Phycisphaerales bacterium]
MFMHLTTIVSNSLIPIVPALIMWLVKRKDSEFLDDTGKEVLNFQISLVIYGIISGILMVIVIGIPLFVAVYILAIVGLIKGAIAANKGRYFRYPMCIRFIK